MVGPMISLDIQQGAGAERWRIDPCAVLYELAERHPGEPAVLHLGYEDIVLFQDAEAARHIAHTNVDNYRKNLAGFRQFFGSSRLTNDDDAWRRSQRLSQPFIAGTDSSFVAGAATRFFSAASQAMLGAAGAAAVEVDPFLNDAAGAVIAEVTLGFGPDDLSSSLSSDFRVILQHAALTTWNVPGAPQISAPAHLAKAMAAKDRLRQGLDRLRTNGAGQSRSGLLDALLDAGDDIDVFAEVCTLLFAGFDTSSAALGWAMWLLAGEPDLQERLRSRLREDNEPAELDAFLAEAMRIFPPVPILSRIAGRDDTVAGIPIAAGQKVLLSVIGLHHDANIYPNPKRISLARFPGGEMPAALRGHFLPFGTGQRGCPGSKIARVEIKTAMAVLLRHLHIRRPPDNRLSFEWLASLRRRGGQRFHLAAV